MVHSKLWAFLLFVIAVSAQAELRIESCGFLAAGHPFFSSSEESFAQAFIHSPLFTVDPAGQWTCHLCSDSQTPLLSLLAKTQDKQGKPLLSLKLELAESQKWADGTPLTGDDVALAIKIALELMKKGDFSLAKGVFSPFWQKIDHVYIDPKNRRVITLYFFALESDVFAFPSFFLLPAHYFRPEKAEEGKGELLAKVAQTYTHDFQKNAFALATFSGHFVPEKRSGHEVTFKRNPGRDHNGNKLASIRFIEGPYGSASSQAGQKDAFKCAGFSKNSKAAPESQLGLSFKSQIYEVLIANQRNPILLNPKLRIPLLEFAAGQSSPDPALIERRLHSLGWKKNLTQGYSNMDKDLNLNLVVKEDPERIAEAKKIKDRLHLADISLEVASVNQVEYQRKIIERSDFHSLALMAWPMPQGDYLRSYFHSREIPSFENGYQGQNYAGWQSTEVDKIYETLLHTFEPEIIEKLAKEIHAKIEADRPVVALYEYQETFFVPPGFTGLGQRHPLVPASQHVDRWALVKH